MRCVALKMLYASFSAHDRLTPSLLCYADFAEATLSSPTDDMQSGDFDSAASDTSGTSAESPALPSSSAASRPTFEAPFLPRTTLDGAAKSPMRRNESAAAQLQAVPHHALPPSAGGPLSSSKDIRRNASSTALSELRMLESKGPSSSTDRRDVIEAVVLHLHELMLAAGASTEAAEGSAVRDAMQTYIETIVRQLELPNSCIVAMVIYVQRAVDDARFTLTVRNWQPCLLAAVVVAAGAVVVAAGAAVVAAGVAVVAAGAVVVAVDAAVVIATGAAVVAGPPESSPPPPHPTRNTTATEIRIFRIPK